MVDECEITRVDGEPGEIDPETGERSPAPTVTVYTGRCKIQTYEPHESKPEAGEHRWTVQRYYAHLPVSAAAAQVGDQLTVTAATVDPQLDGRTYVVAGVHAKSLATARRLLLDEVTG